jgi:redox-sensitive bicupin YhaK (pirin superfamily)
MTAAGGIVHEENPDDAIRERGGRIHGLQLWVNLPARAKFAPPRYQDQVASRIPHVEDAGVSARVIAGEAHGVSAVIASETPLALIDYAIEPGSEVALEYPDAWTAFVHVIEGTATVGGALVPAAHLAVMGRAQSGSGIHLANPGKTRTRLVLGGGEPIAEPLARYGPFAMNTEAELRQAFDDYRAGRMGRVANPTYDRVRLR